MNMPSPAVIALDSYLRVEKSLIGVKLDDRALEESCSAVMREIKSWDSAGFTVVRTLQDAVRNHGRVDLMTKDGKSYAVKRMPTRWVRLIPSAFTAQFPRASERPWGDMGLVKLLNKLEMPFVCEMMGLLHGDQEMYVVSTFCTGGDLFAWCDREKTPAPGKAREAVALPILEQVFLGVRWLHEVGVAHRDLSLENVLLTDDGEGGESARIIDSGMATMSTTVTREVRGRAQYQAPEMHVDDEVDTFLADEFAAGVLMFAMLVKDFPWVSTKPVSCNLFNFIGQFGLRHFLEKRTLAGSGQFLCELLSPEIIEVLEALLQLKPEARGCFGEAYFLKGSPTPTPSCSSPLTPRQAASVEAGGEHRIHVFKLKLFKQRW